MNNKKFTIKTSTLKGMCQRVSYAIAKDKSRSQLLGYQFRILGSKLEVFTSDGYRLAYQYAEIEDIPANNPGWCAGILKADLEAMLGMCPWPILDVSLRDGGPTATEYVVFANASNPEESIPLAQHSPWKLDVPDSIVHHRKVLYTAKSTVTELREMVAREVNRPPLTYKDMDTDMLMFVWAKDGKLFMSKGERGDAECDAETSIQKKFISEAAKSLTAAGDIEINFSIVDKNLPMLNIREKSGGHAMMPLLPPKTRSLRTLNSGQYFRVKNASATFQKRMYTIVRVDGAHPEGLKRSPGSETEYDLSGDLQVYEETYDQGKARERRAKKKPNDEA